MMSRVSDPSRMKFLVTEPDKIPRAAEILAESKNKSRMSSARQGC